MPGLHLYRSNRLENLAIRLAGILNDPLPSPLQPELMVVQSAGMRRWLALQLADLRGIVMNVRFLFPGAFAQEVFHAMKPSVQQEDDFNLPNLAWRILASLPKFVNASDAEPLRQYLHSEPKELKAYQLSTQIASVFDRYIVQRPELLLSWQTDEDTGWQAALWRELIRDQATTNPPAQLLELNKRAEAGSLRLPRIPDRISIFGVSTMSQSHLQLLLSLAKTLDVHLFVFEPTPEYWGDIRSVKEQDRILSRKGTRDENAAAFHLEIGNPLLASWGKSARAFSKLLADLEPDTAEGVFRQPVPAGMLGVLQRDIFALQDQRSESTSLSELDSSIQIHCCHSPAREVEVLYDQLLDLFERIPGLTPKDIVVMAPDIEEYAPFVEAVFGTPEDETLRIPFSIADRRVASESHFARTFLSLLELAGSRFGFDQVLGLLESEAIRREFNLKESDLDRIRALSEAAGIRWGIDGKQRATLGIPAFEQNSWRQGLDRILLGYAMASDGRQLFGDLLPLPGVEGDAAEVAGSFVDFADKLFRHIEDLNSTRTLGSWATCFRELLSTFFNETSVPEMEVQGLRRAIDHLADLERYYSDDVGLAVIMQQFVTLLEENDSGFNFLAGRTTFCSLRPLRSVPFRVVCMLGLNDTAFPRVETQLPFDITVQKPGVIDRSRRDEDKQLFLEALLSARDVFYISYDGLSTRDHRESPPSTVVGELLDYVGFHCQIPPAEIVVRHPLQPFSERYFSGESRLFSYSAENERAAHARRAKWDDNQPFIRERLDLAGETEKVTVEQLARFFRHPSRFFLQERLGIYLERDREIVEPREPMEFGALQRVRITEKIIEDSLARVDIAYTMRAVRASGILPLGWSGDRAFHEAAADSQSILSRIEQLAANTPHETIAINLTLGGWSVTGNIGRYFSSGLLRFRGARLKAKDLLGAWLEHLVANVAAGESKPIVTNVVAIDASATLNPPSNSASLLTDLLELYAQGLRFPLSFYPESSLAYAKPVLAASGNSDRMRALDDARKTWFGNAIRNASGEKDDDYIRLVTRGYDDPLNASWEEVSLRIFRPLLENIVLHRS